MFYESTAGAYYELPGVLLIQTFLGGLQTYSSIVQHVFVVVVIFLMCLSLPYTFVVLVKPVSIIFLTANNTN